MRYLEYLNTIQPTRSVDMNGMPAATVYILDEISAARMAEAAKR